MSFRTGRSGRSHSQFYGRPMHRNLHAPRPVLLILVYGIFLVLIGITASAQAVLVSEHFSTSILDSTVANDAATVRTFVNGNLSPADLTLAAAPDRVVTIEQQLSALVARGEILRAEVRTPQGMVLFSNEPSIRGMQAPPSAGFSQAAGGQAAASLGDSAARAETTGPSLAASSLIREYLPVIANGKVQAVFALWRDAAPVLARLDATRRDILIVTLAAALIAAAILYLVFRSAQGRLTRQTRQLLEATRRDALTGMLNHGAMVELLQEAVESARSDDANVTVALVDIDNFRLLNETHGHAAGDQALLTVSRILSERLPAGIICGRFGPDEFLLVAPPRLAARVEPSLRALSAILVNESLQFGASERLPITVSAGVAVFPDHAESVVALLSVAAATLGEAKASGGDAIQVANPQLGNTADQSTFDILQGLVIAVDTKDRYTKRHSEDVARYALFLADQIDLDAETRGILRVAGLLHDVGKIGIPDGILRKPGILTDDERGIIQQHVLLGDAIVRNLPNIDQIRAGIRHHHERWDGTGYLDRLAGEEIPLIARVIAVGDAFSAMTTSRPYRKALSVKEALQRLEDAAGTQLDERLVVAFVRGIETAEHPPLPGEEATASRLWTPAGAVA